MLTVEVSDVPGGIMHSANDTANDKADDTLSYAQLADLVGRRFTAGPHGDLVIEEVSTPWRCEGRLSYSVLLTGPVEEVLPRDLYRLTDGDLTLALTLEPVARDARYTHYEAFLSEPAGLLAAG